MKYIPRRGFTIPLAKSKGSGAASGTYISGFDLFRPPATKLCSTLAITVSFGTLTVRLGEVDEVLVTGIATGPDEVGFGWDEFLLNPKVNKLAWPVLLLDITKAIQAQ